MAVEAGSIGARLRAGREKMGLTVLQVAERLHTDSKIIEALEADNYGVMGAPVYARGHIRHYAELVGESVADLTAQYNNLSKVEQPDLTRIVKAPSSSDSNKLVASAVIVIGVFAVAGAIWWVSALSKKKPQMSETHLVEDEQPAPSGGASSGGAVGDGTGADAAAAGGENTTATQGSPVTGQTIAPGASGSALGGTSRTGEVAGGRGGSVSGSASAPGGGINAPSGGGGGSGSGAGPRGTAGAQGRATASGASTSGGASAVGGNAGTMTPRSSAPPHSSAPGTGAGVATTTSARGVAAASNSPSAQKPPQPTRLASAAASVPMVGNAASSAVAPASSSPAHAKNQSQVTLRYSADSWTEVYDATGARLFYDVGSANSVQTMVGTPPLRIVLGNASGVAVEFNGHNTPIAKLAHPDGSVQFSINSSGRVVRAKPVADGG